MVFSYLGGISLDQNKKGWLQTFLEFRGCHLSYRGGGEIQRCPVWGCSGELSGTQLPVPTAWEIITVSWRLWASFKSYNIIGTGLQASCTQSQLIREKAEKSASWKYCIPLKWLPMQHAIWKLYYSFHMLAISVVFMLSGHSSVHPPMCFSFPLTSFYPLFSLQIILESVYDFI